MNVVTVIGARPQFIKASAVSRELRWRHKETLVHTGQHYDYAMSGVFFEGLQMPAVDINLGVGSGSHGAQTAAMLQGLEKVLLGERPDWVLVYGDTNSTLAAALAAAKLGIPVAHVEAGLRSFNRDMPEEINRVVVDHISDLLLCPSSRAVANLKTEGISKHVHLIGDVMLDVLNEAKGQAEASEAEVLSRFGVTRRGYLLATVHRSENTNDLERFTGILDALNTLNEPIIFPIHPRSLKTMHASGYKLRPHVKVIEPLGYFEMIALSGAARMILTDSGGLQKEAYWLKVPCITLRDESEWLETVDAGWNVLAGAVSDRIVESVRSFRCPSSHLPLYGDGKFAAKCIELLERVDRVGAADAVSTRRGKSLAALPIPA